MTLYFVIFIVLGAIAGGFINGLAGTGTALFALVFFLTVLPPKSAVAVVSVLAVLAGSQGLWVVRRDIQANKAKLLRFLIPGLLGVPIGISLLAYIDTESLRLLIGVLLVVYGGYFSFREALPAINRATPLVDVCVGFVGGLLGGMAALAGAIPGMWLTMRPWTKGEIRSVLQTFNVAILITTVVLLFINGSYDSTTLKALLIALPVALIASQIGILIFKKITDTQFRRLLIGLSLLMGIGILLQRFMS